MISICNCRLYHSNLFPSSNYYSFVIYFFDVNFHFVFVHKHKNNGNNDNNNDDDDDDNNSNYNDDNNNNNNNNNNNHSVRGRNWSPRGSINIGAEDCR